MYTFQIIDAFQIRGVLAAEKPDPLPSVPNHIQAPIGGKVIALKTIGAMRMDLTAKCHGGDISPKKRLLQKQKKGKPPMREHGNAIIP